MNQYHFNKIKQLKDWEVDLRSVLVFKNDVLDKETERELSKQIQLLTYAIQQAERVHELERRIADDEHYVAEILEQNKRYREVLEFYADRNNYKTEHYDPNIHEYMSVMDYDEGEKARKTLEVRK